MKINKINKVSYDSFDKSMAEIKEIGNSFDSTNDDYMRALHTCHSNAIEGSTYSIDETLQLLNESLGYVPVNKSDLETTEIKSTIAAYIFLETKYKVGAELDIELIKDTQRLIKQHSLSYTHPNDAAPGEYKLKQNRGRNLKESG